MEEKGYTKHRMNTSINVDKVITHIYYEFDKDFDYSGESHNFWELVYVDKGEVIIGANTKQFILYQGEIYFHKPNEFHKIRANGKTAPNVFITTFVCRSAAMSYFKNRRILLKSNAREIIAKIVEEGGPIFRNKGTSALPLEEPIFGGQQMMKLYMEMLLITLIRDDNSIKVFSSKESLENHITKDVVKILEDNLYSTIGISDICTLLNYGKTYLCRIFKEGTGKSIMRYYSELKVKEAKKLIREKNYNFTEISNMLMFNNPHYFSHVFKSITNMTPREYKNSVRFD